LICNYSGGYQLLDALFGISEFGEEIDRLRTEQGAPRLIRGGVADIRIGGRDVRTACSTLSWG
jgi:hypothetical protein